jgi:hypothetical protein
MHTAYTVSQPGKTLHEHHLSCTRERTSRAARTKKSVGMHLIAAVGEPEMRVCNRAVGWPEMDSMPPIGQTEFVAVGSVCRDSITFGVRERLHPRQIFIARDTFNMCHQSYESVSSQPLVYHPSVSPSSRAVLHYRDSLLMYLDINHWSCWLIWSPHLLPVCIQR